MGSLVIEVKIETSDLPPDLNFKESTKFIGDSTEDDKGQWIELSDDELKIKYQG